MFLHDVIIFGNYKTLTRWQSKIVLVKTILNFHPTQYQITIDLGFLLNVCLEKSITNH